MVFKIFMCVLVFLSWSIAVVAKLDTTPVSETSELKKNTTQRLSCGGWGKRITNIAEYRKIKHKCYLALRNGELCCIDLPDCPPDLQPEIPLKPYHLFPIKKLSLGCVKPENGKKKKKIWNWESQNQCVLRRSKQEKGWSIICQRSSHSWWILGYAFIFFVVLQLLVCLFIKLRIRMNFLRSETI